VEREGGRERERERGRVNTNSWCVCVSTNSFRTPIATVLLVEYPAKQPTKQQGKQEVNHGLMGVMGHHLKSVRY
jgi:hypothetical protein